MDPQRVAEHYDELDPFYWDVWGEHVHHGLWERGDELVEEAVGALSSKVVDALGVAGGSRVVDIGCGYGATARMIAQRTGADVEGWTVSRLQYERAAERGGARFHHADWMDNRCVAGAFDGAVSIECLSHLEDVGGFFREIERVLKPGGRLVLCCWMSGDGWLSNRVAGPICRGGRFAGIRAEAEIRRSGIEVESFEDLTRGVRKTWPRIIGRVVARLLTLPDYRQRFLWGAGRRELQLAWTVFLTLAGFYCGGLRYGFFVFRKAC